MCLLLLWGRQYNTLKVSAKELLEVENGYFQSMEEMEVISDEVLSDNFGYIAEVNEMENDENYTETDSDNTDRIDVSENSEENGEVMSDDQFRIMIIFCFGLCAGVVVGHFLTGFIK